ncbi:MAG: CinA family protein [Planctomycetota bacterium]
MRPAITLKQKTTHGTIKLNSEAVQIASNLVSLLTRIDKRIVLAESCTAGRIAATLGVIPGVSNYFCGAQVIYRNASKEAWLGVSAAILNDPKFGPVSATASIELASNLLQRTTEADFAFAVTGDIGPNAPSEKDGRIFCSLRSRGGLYFESEMQLHCQAPESSRDLNGRETRLNEATVRCLDWIVKTLRA